MSSNARELMQFGKAVPLEETLHQINQVKREDIFDCLERYFKPEKMACTHDMISCSADIKGCIKISSLSRRSEHSSNASLA